jgi:hypothetical protein
MIPAIILLFWAFEVLGLFAVHTDKALAILDKTLRAPDCPAPMAIPMPNPTKA